MKVIEREFDWQQDDLVSELTKEIEYIWMFYNPEEVKIISNEPIKIFVKE